MDTKNSIRLEKRIILDPALDAYLLGLFTGRGVDVGSENIG